MNNTTSNLVRWRADPTKIKVSVKKHNELEWGVRITELETGESMYYVSGSVLVALECVLIAAQGVGYKGIDLNMDCVYHHPWK